MKIYEVFKINSYIDVDTDHPINVGAYIVRECEYDLLTTLKL